MMRKISILTLVIVILIILNTNSIRGEKSGKRISESLPSINYKTENKARIDWRPKSFVHPLVHVALNGFRALTLTIENIGTDTLYVYNISSEASWLSIEPDSAILSPGCCPLNVELTITGGSEETFWVDSVRIHSNDQTGNDDVYVLMHVVVSDIYAEPQCSTIVNPTYYICESNFGNLGRQVDTAGFYLHQDPNHPSFLYDGSAILGFTSPDGDSLVGRYIFNENYILPMSELSVESIPGLKTIVVEAEFAPHTPQAPLPWHHQWWYWTIKMKDFVFYSQAPGNKNEQYILLRYMQLYYSPPPDWWENQDTLTAIPETYLGMALDIDCPSDSGAWNYPGSYDSTRRMIYFQGYLGNNNVNEKYRMAIAQRDTCFPFIYAGWPILCCWPDPNTLNPQYEHTPDSVDKPHAMHILRNDSVVYPHNGYYDPELYKWMSLPGDSVQTDTSGNTPPTDYNIVTTGRVIPAQDCPTADTYSVAYALVVSDEENMDKLNERMDMIMCGNANRDKTVSIADGVYLINYMFKGGPEPWLFMADVDGSGDVTITDVVYLNGYLFKMGSPPQCNGRR